MDTVLRLLTFIGLILLAIIGAQGAALRSPVDVATQRAAFAGQREPPLVCPETESLPEQLTSISFYTDPPFYSKTDPEKENAFRTAIAPVRNAEEAMARSLSGFVSTSGDKARTFGDCALKHLLRFAIDGAMVASHEPRATVQVRLFAVTPVLAYVVLVDGGHPIPREDDRRIKAWVRKLADRILLSQRDNWHGNNVDYWGAGALAVAAVALQDCALLDAALRVALQGIEEITPDGTLPKEMARGERALEYSLFATQALAVTLAVAERNGIDTLNRANNGALLRLMRTMARAGVDPDSFVALSHDPKTVLPKYIYQQNFAWTALARRYIDDPSVIAASCKFQPLNVFRAGGRWSALLGSPDMCR